MEYTGKYTLSLYLAVQDVARDCAIILIEKRVNPDAAYAIWEAALDNDIYHEQVAPHVEAYVAMTQRRRDSWRKKQHYSTASEQVRFHALCVAYAADVYSTAESCAGLIPRPNARGRIALAEWGELISAAFHCPTIDWLDMLWEAYADEGGDMRQRRRPQARTKLLPPGLDLTPFPRRPA